MNLVSPGLMAGAIWEELYFDSLAPLAEPGLAAEGMRLADVGSGAGFPGLVLALARPDLAIALVESNQKKGKFLQAAVAQLAPGRVTVVNMDVHEYAAHAGARRFDLVTFKAFAAAAACVDIGRKLAKPGGTLLLYKGADITVETNEAKNRFPTGIYRVMPYQLPVSGKERNLILVSSKSK
jgi:16S rRNA (guanine527-N7)-methyltransferase